ncbi:hypothetical protein [Auritidibacter ignavus]|uniref:hypothetical protein n=1 Tax=Auritidibacter ignavus TaxID=678932 RepID=UPI00244CCD29|nr:hypothetical protein [Auritidibacter ignavus]WGH85490.1 hypothetical protein QDX24_07825 [Auritidibacter ignavus]WGH87776.1 hypothetical protein QDX22_07820 [Auritidibacter ignavus]WHS33960.1 hypothetical protein QM403_06155 [Auritidibacter ignavus]
MSSEKSQKVTSGEIGLLVAIALVATIAFSPIGSSFSIGGIDLVAWFLYALMVLSPVVALIMALRSRKD